MEFDLKNITEILKFYQAIGLDVFFDSAPNNFYSENGDEKKSAIIAVEKSESIVHGAVKNSVARVESNDVSVANSAVVEDDKIYATSAAVAQSKDIANTSGDLKTLRKKTEESSFCQLKKYAMSTVFGEGLEANPDVMIIGEAPGADEDKQGRPFVGASGKLLDKIFETIGISREKNAYITNIVKWRPPGNRTPTREECLVCMPILRRQIELIKPKIIVLAGGVAAGAVLNTTQGITSIRGRIFKYEINDKNAVKVVPIFHPSYLLRTPFSKKLAYQDVLTIENLLRQQ